MSNYGTEIYKGDYRVVSDMPAEDFQLCNQFGQLIRRLTDANGIPTDELLATRLVLKDQLAPTKAQIEDAIIAGREPIGTVLYTIPTGAVVEFMQVSKSTGTLWFRYKKPVNDGVYLYFRVNPGVAQACLERIS